MRIASRAVFCDHLIQRGLCLDQIFKDSEGIYQPEWPFDVDIVWVGGGQLYEYFEGRVFEFDLGGVWMEYFVFLDYFDEFGEWVLLDCVF